MGRTVHTKQRSPSTWARVSVILDIHEAAMLLGISEVQLRNLSQRGEVPAFKVGTMWRYEKHRLMEFAGAPQISSE